MNRSWWENEDILQQFREWLAQTGRELEGLESAEAAVATADQPSDQPADPLPDLGLRQLVEALTAMRHELKLQTKSGRNLEETTTAALHALESATRQFQSVQAREQEASERAALPLIETLVGLDEALRRGAQALAATHCGLAEAAVQQLRMSVERQFQDLPRWRRWFVRHWYRRIVEQCSAAGSQAADEEFRSWHQGYQLIQDRLERGLAEFGIRRIECVGRPVDPRRMNVVELAEDPQAVEETVVDELRPGYQWGDRVIRFAEVRATRRPLVRPPLRPLESPS